MTEEAFLNKRYRRAPSMVSRQIADEHILVPIRQHANDLGDIYALNELAGYVWDLLDGERRLIDILEHILDDFDVTPDEAQRDLITLIQQYESIDAVETVE